MPKNSAPEPLTADQRIDQLEKTLAHLDNEMHGLTVMLTEMHQQLKEMQHFALKIGQAQNKLHEYISHWPFVRVAKNGKDIS